MKIKTYIELEVEVEYDATPEEKETRDCPGSPAEIEITSAKILQNGADLELTQSQTEAIEDEIWKFREDGI